MNTEFGMQDDVLVVQGNFDFIVGVDEVGRGCLAGPVVAAATIWDRGISAPWVANIADSKKLSPVKRNKLIAAASSQFADLEEPALCVSKALSNTPEAKDWARCGHKSWRLVKDAQHLESNDLRCKAVGVGAVRASTIDQMNIWNATQLAMNQAMVQLLSHIPATSRVALVVDGSLPIKLLPQLQHWYQFTCVAGDSYFKSASFASVVAKVCRDRWMEMLAVRLDGYGFESHKGYGSAAHFVSLRTLGTTTEHRISFLKNL